MLPTLGNEVIELFRARIWLHMLTAANVRQPNMADSHRDSRCLERPLVVRKRYGSVWLARP